MTERMEYIESTGMQYIDTGIMPCHEVIPQWRLSVKWCKIFDTNDELIHDFQPCVSPDSIMGMYDHVEERFLTKQEFIALVENFCHHPVSITISF